MGVKISAGIEWPNIRPLGHVLDEIFLLTSRFSIGQRENDIHLLGPVLRAATWAHEYKLEYNTPTWANAPLANHLYAPKISYNRHR